jgi:hypothetical protein
MEFRALDALEAQPDRAGRTFGDAPESLASKIERTVGNTA